MASSGQFIDFKPSPTVYKDKTPYAASGYWQSSNLIRFKNDGDLAPIGGWISEVPDGYPIRGVPRSALAAQDLLSKKRLFIGTTEKLLSVVEGSCYDLTPVDRTSSGLTDPISTTDTSTNVNVEVVGHNAAVGDYVIFSSLTSPTVGGYDFTDSEFVITAVVDDDNFEIELPTPATSTATGGGTVSIQFLLPSGLSENTTLYGFGAGTFGTPGASGGGYGEPRAEAAVARMRKWGLVKWGEDLLANPAGGAIYLWDATSGDNTRTSLVSGPPTKTNIIKMSPNLRQLVCFGTTPYGTTTLDPLEIRWSNTEDYTDFDPTVAGTTAGTFRIPGDGEIIAVGEAKQEYVIITTTQVWSMYYVGGTQIFSFEKLADNVGCVGQDAIVSVNGLVYWWGFDGFYVYDGSVKKIDCSLQNWANARLAKQQQLKTYAGLISDFHEIMFLYQSEGSTTNEIDSYVKFNWKLGGWDYGELDRSVWVDAGIFETPYALDEAGVLYQHEVGSTANGSGRDVYAESAFFDLDTGTNVMLVDQIVPDMDQDGTVFISLRGRRFTRGSDVEKGPLAVAETDHSVYTRLRARQVAVKFSTKSADFSLGNTRLRILPDGGR